MSRDANGNYTLPVGNPVVSGTLIDTNWANPTLSDIAQEMTNSLSRTGKGGMLVPFKLPDGGVGAPALAFTSEPTSGLYRASALDLRMAVNGVDSMRWVASGAQIWDSGAWKALSDAFITPVAVESATPASGFGGFRYTLTDGGTTLNLFTT